MSEVIITVRGEHTARISPERATVHLSVSMEGADRAAVVDRTLSLAAPVRDSITERLQGGSVAEWSSRRLTVRADRPWNSNGKRLAPVYRAAVDFTATFVDPSEMSLWTTELSGWDGVAVGHVDWHLTPETEAETERTVAAQAVAVAVARAEAYAQALGLTSITPLEVADRGLISSGPELRSAVARGAAFAASPVGAPAMEFQAEDITVSATVEARFRAA
ncbi:MULTISPECIES: SIMPL domain-containing protein [Microbacterium]|uniref:SIMPL domain-containing protein n=1 Tax=Microbacterium TaxID=33882 RepID=UPI00217D1AB0|nr:MULTISPECIES: SIMPL domain-containing protein [Microbacterium]UWF78367.1 SIMPL domain-containing protein [Microbacterium neungamense]WCM56544.1 SIMPL domain-containing protein [Microbacterium sp. EF45047]